MIIFSFLNPIDLGRIQILLKMDTPALMGYTGAVFKDFFGTVSGIVITTMVLPFWILIPVWISARKFGRKDLWLIKKFSTNRLDLHEVFLNQ